MSPFWAAADSPAPSTLIQCPVCTVVCGLKTRRQGGQKRQQGHGAFTVGGVFEFLIPQSSQHVCGMALSLVFCPGCTVVPGCMWHVSEWGNNDQVMGTVETLAPTDMQTLTPRTGCKPRYICSENCEMTVKIV